LYPLAQFDLTMALIATAAVVLAGIALVLLT
jgi:hypothetical protein